MKPPVPFPGSKDFYSGYHVDHFLYYPSILYNTINNYESLKPILLGGLRQVVDKDVLLSLKLALRAQVYHSLEALFELFIGLEHFQEEHLWYRISTSRQNSNEKEIAKIADGSSNLLELDSNYSFESKEMQGSADRTYIDFAFYRDITFHDPIAARKSFENIREFLIRAAKELQDRDEYNAFKHSLRLFPLWMELQISNPLASLTLLAGNQPFTYLKGEKDGSISQVTSDLEYERDYRICGWASALIANLIWVRKYHFKKSNGPFELNHFVELDPDEVFHSERTVGPIRMNWKPIYRKDGSDERADKEKPEDETKT